MGTITIGNRSFETPVMVPSISSFETQLSPAAALQLQGLLGEPITLVSAYDVAQHKSELVPLCREFRQGGVILMDSGGYESSRIARYLRNHAQRSWDFLAYARTAANEIYDFDFQL